MDVGPGSPSGNPFEAALKRVTQLFPPTPAGYKYRIGAQLTLCALLMAVSLTYVILHCIYACRTGMPLWLFKLQKGSKSRWGRPVMINSMLVFSILAFMGGGGQLGSRYYNWMVFIENRPPVGYTAAQFTPWVPVFVQAWFFSITNLQATTAARGKLGSRFQGIRHPLLHNLLLIGAPLIWVVMILPIALVVSAKQDRLFKDSWALEPILRNASASFAEGEPPSMDILYTLSIAQTRLTAQSLEFRRYIVVLCALCLGLSAVIGVMNLCNLFLVWTLRSGARFLRWNNKNTALQDTTVVQEPSWEGMDTNTGFSFGSATVTNSSLRASMPTRKSKASECREIKVFAPTTQDVAMQRLTADLSITIPCVLVLVVIMVVGLGVLIDKQFDRLTWTIQEFTIDGFCYVYTIITTVAICFLIYNLLKASQIQQVVSPLNTTSIDGRQFGSFPFPETSQVDGTSSPVVKPEVQGGERRSNGVPVCNI